MAAIKNGIFAILVGMIALWHVTVPLLLVGGLSHFLWKGPLNSPNPRTRALQTTIVLMAAWALILLYWAGAL